MAGVLEEAKFFGLSKAIEPLEALVQTEELSINGRFTRKEFLRMLSVTSSSSSLRCQVIRRRKKVCLLGEGRVEGVGEERKIYWSTGKRKKKNGKRAATAIAL